METEIYKGYEIEIKQDETINDTPREWDNLGKMICFHSRYDLGDKHILSVEDCKYILDRKDVIALPLYLYDHSGITMSARPFACPWDSGQVGIIYADYESIKKEFNTKRVGAKLREKVRKILLSEVEVYDQYLRGDVYGYVTEFDSLWNIYGYDEALKMAKENIDWNIEDQRKRKQARLKEFIRHKVPLEYRKEVLTK